MRPVFRAGRMWIKTAYSDLSVVAPSTREFLMIPISGKLMHINKHPLMMT
jgi:hypothetical protein